MSREGLTLLWDNLKATPRRFMRSTFRSGAPASDRTRSQFVFGNVFLHLHPARAHRWSLRWPTTMGLGIVTLAAFLITVVTGVMLMFYYKSYPGRGLRLDQGHPLRRARPAASCATSTVGPAT